jgi:hypothetical protein
MSSLQRCQGIRHNDIQHNDIQHNKKMRQSKMILISTKLLITTASGVCALKHFIHLILVSSIIMLRGHYAECHYGECHYAECCYVGCLYAECRGATFRCLHYKSFNGPSIISNRLNFIVFSFKPIKVQKSNITGYAMTLLPCTVNLRQNHK